MVVGNIFNDMADIGIALKFIQKQKKEILLPLIITIETQSIDQVFVGADFFIIGIEIEIHKQTRMIGF